MCKSSRTHRHLVSPPKHTSSATSTYFPITVLYEDKPGKQTPYELVLKPNETIGDVSFFFKFDRKLKIESVRIFR